MKWKKFLLGAAAGFACGYAAKIIMHKYEQIAPETILNEVKTEMKQYGKIIGSWIVMTPEVYTINNKQYKVYRGGYTQMSQEQPIQFEFIADARTGTLIELK